VCEHSEPSEGFPVMDLSSREEDTFPGTSRDEEIARRLFADLNYSLLRPPGDGSVIVLSDSDEEEEVRENDHADVEVMSSSAETPQLQSPLPPMTMTHPMRCQMIVIAVEMRLIRLRLSR
jgi:hypothetical protein